MIETWLVYESFDPFEGSVSQIRQQVSQSTVKMDEVNLNSAQLVPNIYDDLAFLGFENNHKSIQLPLKKMSADDNLKSLLYSFKLTLSPQTNIFKIQRYAILDFISDIAGVAELIGFIFGLFLYPLSQLSFELSTIKRMYVARTADDELLEPRDPIPDQDTGKFKRNVRFKFENGDENKIIDNQNAEALELQKRRTIALSNWKKRTLYFKNLFGLKTQLSRYPDESEKVNYRVARLYDKGKQKLAKDFDVLKIMKDLHEFRILFDFVKRKHSNLMIDINTTRKNVINLQDDGWELELERVEPYLTKHTTYQTRSSDEDMGSDKSETSEMQSVKSSQVSQSNAESKSKSLRSPTSTSKQSAKDEKDEESEETSSVNETVPEDI